MANYYITDDFGKMSKLLKTQWPLLLEPKRVINNAISEVKREFAVIVVITTT